MSDRYNYLTVVLEQDLRDDDAEKIERILAWARNEGKGGAAVETDTVPKLSDQQIEQLVAKREAARRARDFKSSDAIRAQLLEAGVVIEDTKDGVRWKRK